MCYSSPLFIVGSGFGNRVEREVPPWYQVSLESATAPFIFSNRGQVRFTMAAVSVHNRKTAEDA